MVALAAFCVLLDSWTLTGEGSGRFNSYSPFFDHTGPGMFTVPTNPSCDGYLLVDRIKVMHRGTFLGLAI